MHLRKRIYGLIFALLLFTSPSWAQQVKAFPSAEGYGATTTTGGRGAGVIVCKVTNLNDSGAGSLRDCLTGQGSTPRFVIFTVSGTIDLASNIMMLSSHSNVTVAGQSSPGGIQIKGRGIQQWDGFQNGIFRHLRSRPGSPPTGQLETNAWVVAGSNTLETVASQIDRVVIDHCSNNWSNDDLLSVTRYVTNITIQWCLFAEPTNNSDGTPNGNGVSPASGINTALGPRNITVSFHHNAMVHGVDRHPYLQTCDRGDIVNNYFYNWGGNNGFELGNLENDVSCFANFVSNHYDLGGDSSYTGTFALSNGASTQDRGGTKIFTDNNLITCLSAGCDQTQLGCGGALCSNEWLNRYTDADDLTYQTPAQESKYRVSTAYATPAVTTYTITSGDLNEIRKRLLNVGTCLAPSGAAIGAGARRVAGSNGLGATSIDTPDNQFLTDACSRIGARQTGPGGPWPTLSGTAWPDSDNDGCPNQWETNNGLNPNLNTDCLATAANGYLNIENWLNEIAGDTIPGGVPPPPRFKTNYARFREARGSETAAAWKAPQNENYSCSVFSAASPCVFRYRAKVACDQADCANTGIQLRSSEDLAAYAVIPDTCGTTICLGTTTGVSDDGPTTEQLTSDYTCNLQGKIITTQATAKQFDLGQNCETEIEWVVKVGTGGIGKSYEFRPYQSDGTAFGLYATGATIKMTVLGPQGVTK